MEPDPQTMPVASPEPSFDLLTRFTPAGTHRTCLRTHLWVDPSKRPTQRSSCTQKLSKQWFIPMASISTHASCLRATLERQNTDRGRRLWKGFVMSLKQYNVAEGCTVHIKTKDHCTSARPRTTRSFRPRTRSRKMASFRTMWATRPEVTVERAKVHKPCSIA